MERSTTSSPALLEDPQQHPKLPAPAHSNDGHDNADGHKSAENSEEGIPKDLKPASTWLMLLVGIIAVAAFVGLFVLGIVPHIYRTHEAEKQATAVSDSKPVVQLAKPLRKNDAIDLSLPADARAMQETSIYPRATGYLQKQMVDIGDKVQAGQVLAQIDLPDTRADLAQAQASQGQAEANVSHSEKELQLAQATLTRYEGVAATGGVTQQVLDERRAALIEAQSTLEANQANVKAAQASVQRLQTLLNFGQIIAPFSGVISMRNYDVGALMSPTNTGDGREIFRIADVATLRVFVNVPQTYITSIKLGQKALLEVRNYPGEEFTGTVTRSAGALDQTTRTLRYEIDFPNSDGRLFAGMYATAKLPIVPAVAPLTVATSALVFDSAGTQLWTVKDNKAHSVKVVIGNNLGATMEILDGLKGDEQVVTNPGLRLREDAEVTVYDPKNPPPQPQAPAK